MTTEKAYNTKICHTAKIG